MYKVIRNILFWMDAEKAHYFSMNAFKFFCKIPFTKKIISYFFTYKSNALHTNLFGLTFKNPVGLGAGFDKNALYLNELEALGFGFVEIGTVTPKPQQGNEKPRLFRLKKDLALINRMGFNNDGIDVVKERLHIWNAKEKNTNGEKMIIGGNIGKNKITPNEDAWKDYLNCFKSLFNEVDYFVVNVSSPNTPGLRELQEKPMLTTIFNALQGYNHSQKKSKPLLLKIAPDLTHSQLDDIISLANEQQLSGLVVSNTTISREDLSLTQAQINEIGFGGLSGKPLTLKSEEVLHYIAQKTNGKLPLIGSGGIFTAQDALEKINKGASLIQIWTGFIYEGPSIVKRICKSLEV